MQPSKEWSVLTATYCSPNRRAKPNPMVTVTPSKQGFAARFRILDPFQVATGVILCDIVEVIDYYLDTVKALKC